MSPVSSRGRLAAIAVFALLAAAAPAHAGWSADPVEVYSTTATCPLVAAGSDDAYGAIVVWQQNTTASEGVLRAQHLLPTGDVDPAWNGPADVCTAAVPRSVLGAVGDGLGGLYVWWMEGTSVYLTRLAPGGSLAANWPARGRLLGSVLDASDRPTVFADGSHGVYVGMKQSANIVDGTYGLTVAHLGPANTGAGGWSDGPEMIIGGGNRTVLAAALSLAPDGGFWVSWGDAVVIGPGTFGAGNWRLERFTSAGLPYGDWPDAGVALGAFNGAPVGWEMTPMSLVGVATDGGGGAFVVRADPSGAPGSWTAYPRLYRYGGDGLPAPGWSATGVACGSGGLPIQSVPWSDASLRVVSDGHGGVYAGTPWFYDHGVSLQFEGFNGAGLHTPFGCSAPVAGSGLEYVTDPGGELFTAQCQPSGPYGPMDPYAVIALNRTGAKPGYLEYHMDPVVTWYGDAGVAPSGDGGAFFFWSQVRERFGIFAVRVSAEGRVTGAPGGGTPNTLHLALRSEASGVVRARAVLPAAGTARFDLLDVNGRVVSSASFEAAAGQREWIVPGSERLRSGVYFARLRTLAGMTTARVAVTR